MKNQSAIPQASIPEPLKTLLARHNYNYTEATLAMGYKKTSVASLRRIALGEAVLGPVIKHRIEDALAGIAPSVIASSARAEAGQVRQAAKQQKAAALVAGGPATVTLPKKEKKSRVGMPWKDGKQITDYPPLLQKLIKRYDSNLSNVAHALGYKTPHWVNSFIGPKAKPFDKEAKAKVKAALDGAMVQPPEKKAKTKRVKKTETNGIVDDAIDAGSLGVAIVLATPTALEALYDAGEAMDGEWIFRKHIGKQWLAICRLDQKELRAFCAVARAIAISVAMP